MAIKMRVLHYTKKAKLIAAAELIKADHLEAAAERIANICK